MTKNEPRTCKNCRHFQSGDLDRRTNWMRCEQGHRLIPEEVLQEYHSEEEPSQSYRVDPSGWIPLGGDGEPMLHRTDCRDWQRSKFKLNLGNPEYT